jgi:hypothetical protein
MGARVLQVKPVTAWPSGDGWTIGTLSLEPEELAERLGIEFESGRDDLDAYRLAAIAESQVGQLWLFAHENAPQGGTDIIVDRSVTRDIALGALARTLGIDIRSFDWVNPYAECPSADQAPDLTKIQKPDVEGAVVMHDRQGHEVAHWNFEKASLRRLAEREQEVQRLQAELRTTLERLDEAELALRSQSHTGNRET